MMSAMKRRRPSVVALAALAAGTVVGCAGSDDSASTSSTQFTLLPTSTTIETTTTSTTSTTIAATSTTVETTTTTTVAAAPTTAPNEAVADLVLSGDGIGTAGFGADPDGVISYLSSYLGDPTNDTGWIDPLTIGLCSGEELRRVSWGVLTLLFGDVSTVVQGRRHFFGYTYGDTAEIGAEPVGLITSRGVQIGSRVIDVVAAYPAVTINPEDDFTPPFFFVNDSLRGFLTGVDDDATVTAILGGDDCGI
jgi:hypothetical protein